VLASVTITEAAPSVKKQPLTKAQEKCYQDTLQQLFAYRAHLSQNRLDELTNALNSGKAKNTNYVFLKHMQEDIEDRRLSEQFCSKAVTECILKSSEPANTDAAEEFEVCLSIADPEHLSKLGCSGPE
jgi:flagellar biosynthesis chaperone FliJ